MNYDYITNTGDRKINEDSVAITEKNGNYCFVVADGLGGHGKGEEASTVVVSEIIRYFEEVDCSVNCIEPAINSAQTLLLDEQEKRCAKFGMKTTVVMLVIDSSMNAAWGYIGDSRLYMFKKSRIKTRTLDHSVPQMLVLSRSIKEKDIRFHPDRNKLMRVMGIKWENIPYEITAPVKLKKNTGFLLCSDGFWELIDEKTMCAIKKGSTDASSWLSQMAQTVSGNGKEKDMDNYTAVAVICD